MSDKVIDNQVTIMESCIIYIQHEVFGERLFYGRC